MRLKQAIALAVKYADKEGPHACARLVPGAAPRLMAAGEVAGVSIECPDVAGLAEPMAVHAAGLKKMVDAIGGAVELSIAKGRRLAVSGDGSTLSLQALPESKAPTMPDPPDTGWLELDATALASIAAAASVADPEIQTNRALQGVCLTNR